MEINRIELDAKIDIISDAIRRARDNAQDTLKLCQEFDQWLNRLELEQNRGN